MASQNSGASSPSEIKRIRSLGLPKLRQKSGVSLEHIAEMTKISIRFLRAIESEEFDKLPGGLFNTSYIRQYAAAAGFDEGELIARYNEKTAHAVAEPDIPRKTPGSETRSWIDRWFGIAAEAPRS